MPARTPARRRFAAVIGAIEKHNGPTDGRLPGLRRDLRAEQLCEYVSKIVSQAPPLTDEQRAKIAALLRPTGGGST